jgi:hypothetical protein
MALDVRQDGGFSLTVESEQLNKGLRPSKRLPRNSGYLVECIGAVGRDGVLQAIDEITRLATSPSEVMGTDTLNYRCIIGHTAAAGNRPITGGSWATYWEQAGTAGITWLSGANYVFGITDAFPYPQIFVLTNMIIVCSSTKIYEWVNNALVLKLTVTGGSTWNIVDFYDYVYMSNGKVAVKRDAGTKAYSLTTALPIAMGMCNFNGQVLIGGPGVEV